MLDPTNDGPLDGRLVAETGRNISAIGEDEAGEAYATDLTSGELAPDRRDGRLGPAD